MNNYQIVINRINELLDSDKEVIIVAIDGKCGSGKSTLASYLSDYYDCNVFHLDDFFLQLHQRVNQRLLEIGGNVDYERFNEEVLNKLINHQDVLYQPFNCTKMHIETGSLIKFKRLNIIEGSYCNNPHFNDPYDLKIFKDIDDIQQIENIKKRNPDKLEQFINTWIPKENKYFNYYHIKDNCLVIPYQQD